MRPLHGGCHHFITSLRPSNTGHNHIPRYLINFGVFQMVSGELASVSPSTVEGTVRFFQNPFITDSDSKYTVEIKGLAADKKYSVTLSLTAAGAMATVSFLSSAS
jgi:hypothetical protein